jgi:hypothetical protein
MRVLSLLLCAGVLGCEARPEPEAAPPADSAAAAAVDTANLGTLDCGELLESGLRAEPTRAALRAAFGEPDSVRGWTEPNRHIPDVVDSLFVVSYDGLRLELRKPPGGGDMADLAVVTDGRFLARAGLGPGAPAERIVSVLGEPRERGADALRYDCGDVSAPVTFRLAGGTVRVVELDYYLD